MKTLIAMFMLFSAAAFSLEQIENTDLEWFARCEMNQSGFDLNSVSYDYLKWSFPDKYKEYVKDQNKHNQAIEELKKWFGLVSICYPKMEFNFMLSLTDYHEDEKCCAKRGVFTIEPVERIQNLVYVNTIYSALPNKFNIKLTNFELPREIPITENNIKRLNDQGCSKLHYSGESIVRLRVEADIKRVARGEYVSKPLKGVIYMYCPENPLNSEDLMKFDYVPG